ncbi:MAG: hypothetical protein HWE24_16640 [Oceanospirillaceae bacterium]|nr:hypothetical protein [Oceanospirillaceae bacterium]
MNPALLKIKRLQTILYEVGKGYYPSVQDLMDKLETVVEKRSKRSIERDLSSLRDEYYIDITTTRAEIAIPLRKSCRSLYFKLLYQTLDN